MELMRSLRLCSSTRDRGSYDGKADRTQTVQTDIGELLTLPLDVCFLQRVSISQCNLITV